MKVEILETAGWGAAIEGMRNPMNSWNKSDSYYDILCNFKGDFIIGENDLKLCQTLIKGGTEHRKFLRMIGIWMNLWLPRCVWQEWDAYKIGMVSNSCSTIHTIMKKPLTLDDFYLGEEVKELLKKNEVQREYSFRCELPHGEKEYFVDVQGYEDLYKISNTGIVIRKETVFGDINNRKRVFPQKIVKPSATNNGYLELNLRKNKKSKRYLHHRLMAETFIPNPENKPFVNHKDGNKQNNSIENLEWVTPSENNKHAFDTNLKEISNYQKTIAAIFFQKFSYEEINKINQLYKNGKTQKEIAEIYNVKQGCISDIINKKTYLNIDDLDYIKYFIKTIDKINELRVKYIETKDYSYVIRMKRLLPEGFIQKRTVSLNYEVVYNMYHQRKNHRLVEEWQNAICGEFEKLPYFKELIL